MNGPIKGTEAHGFVLLGYTIPASPSAKFYLDITYQAEACIACVNEDVCSGCGNCETVCSCNAIEIVTGGEKARHFL